MGEKLIIPGLSASALNAELVRQDLTRFKGFVLNIKGDTYVGRVRFQGTNTPADVSSWKDWDLLQLHSGMGSIAFLDSTSNVAVGGAASFTWFRAYLDLYTSGTVTAEITLLEDGLVGFFGKQIWTFTPSGSLVDLATLLTLHGAPGDANTVNSFMGRLTKIRDLLLGTLAISAASLPLPSGAATSAKQDTIIGHIDGIETALAGLALESGGNLAGILSAMTPTTFKAASATASGNTALWTPASGKKFRLTAYMIQATSNVATSGGDVIDVELQDSSTSLPFSFSFFAPAAALTTSPVGHDTGWVTLGKGKLSSTADNVLNINLSAALTSGKVRVVAIGIEE